MWVGVEFEYFVYLCSRVMKSPNSHIPQVTDITEEVCLGMHLDVLSMLSPLHTAFTGVHV